LTALIYINYLLTHLLTYLLNYLLSEHKTTSLLTCLAHQRHQNHATPRPELVSLASADDKLTTTTTTTTITIVLLHSNKFI